MKKIVALVLSLVMVLGLATVAFGAVNYSKTSVDAEDWVITDLETASIVAELDEESEVDKVVYADYTETVNGVTTKYYGVTYYTFDGYAGIVVADEAANVQIETADGKFIYLYAFDDAYLPTDAADFYTDLVATEFVEAPVAAAACGECEDDYFVVGEDNFLPFDGYTMADYQLAVYKNEFVLLSETEADLVPHVCLTDDGTACKWSVKDNKVVSVTCKCGDVFKVVQDIKGLKAGTYAAVAYGEDNFIVLAATPAVDTDTTEKVESAETFDAGIAMYVGMSVMAAAGSAVVLKKKD